MNNFPLSLSSISPWTSYKIFKGFGSEDEEYEMSLDDGEVRRKEEKKEETKKKSKWFIFTT